MGRCPLIIPLGVLVLIIIIGDFCGLNRPQKPLSFGYGNYSAYLLTVEEASTAGFIVEAEIDSVDNKPVAGFKARIHFLNEEPLPVAGMRAEFRAKLRPMPDVPAIPDAIDMQSGMRRRGVTATMAVPADSIRYMLPTRSLRYYCAKANNAALTRLKQSDLSPQAVNVLAAMLLGRSQFIDSDTRLSYSSAGLSHVLALSGLHVGFIAMIIAFALWPLYFGRHVRTRLLLTVIALWGYASLTGFIPSVTRAVIMASVYLGARILERHSLPLNSLCLAAIVILIVSPSDLFSPGFQMSFAAVAGIIIFMPLLNRVNRRKHPRLYALLSYPALSLSAMIFTSIVAAYHFHTFPSYFLLANLLAVPLIPAAMFSGLIALAFNICRPSNISIELLDYLASAIASLPGATVDGLYPSVFSVIWLIAVLCLLAYGFHSQKRFIIYESVVLFLGTFACFVLQADPIYPEREEYEVIETGSVQRVISENGRCIVVTDAITAAEREELARRYAIVLRDFISKRRLSGPEVIFVDDYHKPDERI